VSAAEALVDALLAGRVTKKSAVATLASPYLPQVSVAVLRKLGTFGGFRYADGSTEILPLFAAIERNAPELAHDLLEAGASATQATRDGKTALVAALDDLAASDEKLRLVRALLARGADPNRTEPGGDTPLVKAVGTGDVRLVVALLDRGARINHGLAERDASSTALEIAEASGNPAIVRVLVQRGARRRPVPPSDGP
jgi:ankyrin repeat protein